MGRSPCCEKVGLKKGPWTPEEDQKLLAYIEEHGHGSWRALPGKAGLQRCGKSCRLRWTNYLRPDIKRGKFSQQEEQTIIQLHALLGNRWSAIATHLPKRTDNEIKNYWNTHLKKRLAKMGIDPVTHKPKADALGSAADGHSKSAANLSHMAQWESARMEAEARLARESKLRAPSPLQPQQQPLHLLGSSLSSAPLQPPDELCNKTSPPPCLDMLRAWQGIWSKPAGGGGGGGGSGIDLESPTSTTSFSGSMPLMIPAVVGLVDGHRGGDDLEGEDVEWKCFQKPMLRMSAGKDRADGFPEISMEAAGFSCDAAWLQEPLGLGTGLIGREFGAGFTGMLLDNSGGYNSSEGCGESDNVEGGSCVEEGEGEENKSYWSSILNLVNSSSPSNSPPVF